MNWLVTIFIGTIFFIIGQICLRKSFELNNTILQTFLLFTCTIGIMSIPFFVYKPFEKPQSWLFPILAGIFFFMGNYFWIKTISSKESLGLIRIAMAGFETILLFFLSYLFFSDKITLYQFIGSLFILFGIGLATL
tara:strand:- start:348 stop:755 length:408 start_codon:yes stop_codon:yes gene_type:complete